MGRTRKMGVHQLPWRPQCPHNGCAPLPFSPYWYPPPLSLGLTPPPFAMPVPPPSLAMPPPPFAMPVPPPSLSMPPPPHTFSLAPPDPKNCHPARGTSSSSQIIRYSLDGERVLLEPVLGKGWGRRFPVETPDRCWYWCCIPHISHKRRKRRLWKFFSSITCEGNFLTINAKSTKVLKSSCVILRGKILWPKMCVWKKMTIMRYVMLIYLWWGILLLREPSINIFQHFIRCIANGECPMKKKVAPGIDRLFQLPHK